MRADEQLNLAGIPVEALPGLSGSRFPDGADFRLTEPRGVVGFEVILGAYSPLSIAALAPVSLTS